MKKTGKKRKNNLRYAPAAAVVFRHETDGTVKILDVYGSGDTCFELKGDASEFWKHLASGKTLDQTYMTLAGQSGHKVSDIKKACAPLLRQLLENKLIELN